MTLISVPKNILVQAVALIVIDGCFYVKCGGL
jgi:hypothetical protein